MAKGKSQAYTNKQLYKSAVDAIHRLYKDQSVSREVARRNLTILAYEIEILLDTIKED